MLARLQETRARAEFAIEESKNCESHDFFAKTAGEDDDTINGPRVRQGVCQRLEHSHR